MKFRKKPVVIEAYQWSGAAFDDIVKEWNPPLGTDKCIHCEYCLDVHGRISTLEGAHIVCLGDWIITGIKDESYPCKPDIFAATYETVE